MNQIITIKIGRRIYEKVCSCINSTVITFPQTNLKTNYKRIVQNKNYTYTEEMQERAIRIKAAKRIREQNKLIDFQRFKLKLILNTNNEVDFIYFVCKQLVNFKFIKQEKIVKEIYKL